MRAAVANSKGGMDTGMSKRSNWGKKGISQETPRAQEKLRGGIFGALPGTTGFC
jgi:hypothetical protein